MPLTVPTHDQIVQACQSVKSHWGSSEAQLRHRQAEIMQRRLAMALLIGSGQVAMQPVPVR
ncbi:MAG: hypothetical protein AAGA92_13690 [Planctomycetota bacterium]